MWSRFGSGATSAHITTRLTLGLLIALGVGALIGALLAIIWQAADLFGNSSTSSTDLWHLLRMSSIQAGLSVLLAFATGGFTAIALSRLYVPAKPLILAFLSAGLVLPTLVVAFGLLSIWGRSGLINDINMALGGDRLPISVFGLHGILAAHTVLNGSFAARVFYDRLQAIPNTSLKLGQSLNLSGWQRYTILDWPVLKATMPGLGATIFLMCFTSFSVVLLLGGGPNNATFEVAIFEAVRLDFDLHRAALLAASQLAFCLLIIIPTASLKSTSLMVGGTQTYLWTSRSFSKSTLSVGLVIMLIAYASPLLIIVWNGIDVAIIELVQTRRFVNALTTSIFVATTSATLTLLLALTLAFARADLVYKASENANNVIIRTVLNAPVFAYLAMPSIVLGLGFFLLARLLGLDTDEVGIYVVILANALLALPLANATLGPPVEEISAKHRKLMRSLNLGNWQRITQIELPLVRKQCAYIFALGFSFSFGDLGVIALFGTNDFTTLPWLMYRALGAYRSNDAGMIAAILLIISVFSFYIIPKLLGGKQNA